MQRFNFKKLMQKPKNGMRMIPQKGFSFGELGRRRRK
jgi:hypothetical protein